MGVTLLRTETGGGRLLLRYVRKLITLEVGQARRDRRIALGRQNLVCKYRELVLFKARPFSVFLQSNHRAVLAYRLTD